MTKKDDIQNKEHIWKFTNIAGTPMEAVYDVTMDKFLVWREADVNENNNVTSHWTYDPEEVEWLLSKGEWKKT